MRPRNRQPYKEFYGPAALSVQTLAKAESSMPNPIP